MFSNPPFEGPSYNDVGRSTVKSHGQTFLFESSIGMCQEYRHVFIGIFKHIYLCKSVASLSREQNNQLNPPVLHICSICLIFADIQTCYRGPSISAGSASVDSSITNAKPIAGKPQNHS